MKLIDELSIKAKTHRLDTYERNVLRDVNVSLSKLRRDDETNLQQ
jgi:hypothetical protein